jgi:hypothetical protein
MKRNKENVVKNYIEEKDFVLFDDIYIYIYMVDEGSNYPTAVRSSLNRMHSVILLTSKQYRACYQYYLPL